MQMKPAFAGLWGAYRLQRQRTKSASEQGSIFQRLGGFAGRQRRVACDGTGVLVQGTQERHHVVGLGVSVVDQLLVHIGRLLKEALVAQRTRMTLTHQPLPRTCQGHAVDQVRVRQGTQGQVGRRGEPDT